MTQKSTHNPVIKMSDSLQYYVLFYFVSLLLLCAIKWTNGGTINNKDRHVCCPKLLLFLIEFFLVKPGGGEEFVYSPIEVNATIYCAVNNTSLGWEVDDLILDSELHRPVFQPRGIFQEGPVTSSDGVTTSSVTDKKVKFHSRHNKAKHIC